MKMHLLRKGKTIKGVLSFTGQITIIIIVIIKTKQKKS